MAQAGRLSTVIATNMAGRGTDYLFCVQPRDDGLGSCKASIRPDWMCPATGGTGQRD